MATGGTPRAGNSRSEPGPGAEHEPPFPFIVGSGRSGTTLMRAMLDSHPEVAVPPETYFITELLPRVSRYEQDTSFATRVFLRDILGNQWFRRWELPADGVRQTLLTEPPTDYSDAIRSVYRLFARAHGKARYADKTPVYVNDVHTLAGLFPEARFVHVIRDGRDVAASFIDQEEMRPNGVAEAALLWRQRVSAGRSAGAPLGPKRYLEVRYEDLVGDTEAALRSLCAFVDLEYDSAMLTYPERAGDLVARDGGPRQHRGVFMQPQVGLRDWRAELSSAAVEVFELVAGDLLSELGYERSTDTRWAQGNASVALLIDEVERLQGELGSMERGLRTKIRSLRSMLREARASEPGSEADSSRRP